MPVLSAIYRYPVKSVKGLAMSQSEVTPLGLPDDRAWMVTSDEGVMITGRDYPEMVKIETDVDAHSLTLSAPGMPMLSIERSQFSAACDAHVWKDQFGAWTGAHEADAWISDYLGRKARLLYTGDPQRRVRQHPDIPLSFADGYPLLLIGESSRLQLNEWVGRDMDMARFRPNLVVSGAEAFAEDGWKTIRIGNVVFQIDKPCGRCVFTTVDPHTAQKSDDQEPLRTIAKRRKGPEGAEFGQNVLARNAGQIETGMPVEILD
ncbi:hypothetical protein GCM10010970_17010 [Silvimonas iriomotensis]|uniref:MOSC domain-containing protein n=2 Tax=Silvimonas iriomotensis TaxID=449662 RepID=A0ABQ2P8I1_9NEIS|nr:hypothetical protein GCM10010970_17010 [Silvimonas iriomotensis]